MSSKNIKKKRCIVQKLDFENCVVTSIKTTARGRKKLRARITREIEHFSDIPREIQACKNSSDGNLVITQNTQVPQDTQVPEPTSPVLIKKLRKDGSPVFFKAKKLYSPSKRTENLSDNSIVEETFSSPGSPVFKTIKKHKLGNLSLNTSQDIKNVLGGMTSLDVFNSRGNSSSDRRSSFVIEDFTQESSQSVKISSIDSTYVKENSSGCYSVEQNYSELSTLYQRSPVDLSDTFCILEKRDCSKSVRKKCKKNSLLARLHRLQQKQASEKLLWQHQNRKNLSGSLKLTVVSFWKEESNYFLKCQLDFEQTFLIVDSRWVPAIKKVKEGSQLQLHPPWQKLSVEEPVTTVLLNVICLEILDETKEPRIQKRTFESVLADPFDIDKKLFVDSLFSSCKSDFLC